MLLSHNRGYLTAKSSIYYWQKQKKMRPEEKICDERLAWWASVLLKYRKACPAKGGRMPASLNKKNPLYIPPVKVLSAKKEDVKRGREIWVPVALSWD